MYPWRTNTRYFSKGKYKVIFREQLLPVTLEGSLSFSFNLRKSSSKTGEHQDWRHLDRQDWMISDSHHLDCHSFIDQKHIQTLFHALSHNKIKFWHITYLPGWLAEETWCEYNIWAINTEQRRERTFMQPWPMIWYSMCALASSKLVRIWNNNRPIVHIKQSA